MQIGRTLGKSGFRRWGLPGAGLAAVLGIALLLVSCPVWAYTYQMGSHPIGESYKSLVAFLRQDPVDWSAVKAAFSAEARQQIAEAEVVAGRADLDGLIDAAITKKSAQDVLAAFEQGAYYAIRYKLNRAWEAFDDAKRAKAILQQIELIYEAFDPKVKAAGPEDSRAIGEGFLQLADSLGNPGFFGYGKKAGEPDQFAAIRKEMERRLAKHLLPGA